MLQAIRWQYSLALINKPSQLGSQENSWVIKIGRELDFFQNPDSWYGTGASDLSLHKCPETKVDIYRK